MLTTTFALLHAADACTSRYRHLCEALGGVTAWGRDTPIPLVRILETNGLNDALWALRAVPKGEVLARDRLARLLACDYAERALPVWAAAYPDDLRPREAIAVARRFAAGQATREELAAAAQAAADAATAAADADERAWQAARFREVLEGDYE